MRFIYNKIMEICSKQQSQKFLYFISVIESIFFPIPPDLFMMPIQLAKREKAILIGLWVTLFSVAGGVIGYYIGYFFYDTLGVKIISFYGLQEKFLTFSNSISKSTEFWIIFTAGLTPIPYKLFTLGGGFFKFDILQFIIASLISRGLRFLFISFLIWKFGEYIKNFIEKYLNILSILFALLLIGGFVAVKYLF
ncbi:MAG: DedA family protein [Pelagibacterales bacterium]|nr:DedA family protein [Pelagibacterales bacterium]